MATLLLFKLFLHQYVYIIILVPGCGIPLGTVVLPVCGIPLGTFVDDIEGIAIPLEAAPAAAAPAAAAAAPAVTAASMLMTKKKILSNSFTIMLEVTSCLSRGLIKKY